MGTHSRTEASFTLLHTQSSPQSHILFAKEPPTTNCASPGASQGHRRHRGSREVSLAVVREVGIPSPNPALLAWCGSFGLSLHGLRSGGALIS